MAILPALPLAQTDVTLPTVTGSTFPVNAGDNLQAAINQAAAADPNLNHQVVLQAGATFTGHINLPARAAGTGWIIIRSSAEASLPPPGTRVQPSHAVFMSKIVANTGPYGVETAKAARHYRFIGVEVTAAPGVYIGAFFNIWPGSPAVMADYPHHIILDRIYLHGDPGTANNKGVHMAALNGAVVDSYITDIRDPGNGDTNAVWITATPGPVLVENNYLAGGGENIFFGAAKSVPDDIHPTDVTVRRNFIEKPLSWKGVYAAKNLVELKDAKRVLIERNIIRNHWPTGQPFAIVLTPRAEGGVTAPINEDITIRFNRVDRVASFFTVSGREAVPVRESARIHIHDNYATDVGDTEGGDGRAVQIGADPADFTAEHNTIINAGTGVVCYPTVGLLGTGWTIQNNVIHAGAYAILSQNGGTFYCSDALNHDAPGYVLAKNVLVGPWPTTGGVGLNYFTAADQAANFFPQALTLNADGSLPAGSPYLGTGTDGKDPGADIPALLAATAGVVEGTPNTEDPPMAWSVTLGLTAVADADLASYNIYVNGALNASAAMTPGANRQFVINIPVDGVYDITNTAVDAAGNESAPSAALHLPLDHTTDTTPPSVPPAPTLVSAVWV